MFSSIINFFELVWSTIHKLCPNNNDSKVQWRWLANNCACWHGSHYFAFLFCPLARYYICFDSDLASQLHCWVSRMPWPMLSHIGSHALVKFMLYVHCLVPDSSLISRNCRFLVHMNNSALISGLSVWWWGQYLEAVFWKCFVPSSSAHMIILPVTLQLWEEQTLAAFNLEKDSKPSGP